MTKASDITRNTIVAVVSLLAMSFFWSPARAQEFVCFPTCQTDDAKMLSLAGSTSLQTLAGDTIRFEFIVPQSEGSLSFDLFDGDTGGMWDTGSVPTHYEVYADPNGDGTGADNPENLVEVFGDDETFADNDWTSVSIDVSPAALAPNGNYYYTMVARNTDPDTFHNNGFKVRTAPGTVGLSPRSFGVIGALWTLSDVQVVYPDFPSETPTTYDGNWSYFLNVPDPLGDQGIPTFFSVWEGDADFGASDCSTLDTDDPDTPSTGETVHASISDLMDASTLTPLWAAGTQAVAEGVATTGLTCSDGTEITGDPADDNGTSLVRRSPSVVFSVVDPDGNTFSEDNPSGTEEWEQFRIDTDASVPADYHVNDLPLGIYEVNVTGLDLSNLHAWRFLNDAVCVTEDGSPCEPPICPANATQFDGECILCEGLDWETDGDGNALSAGDIVSDQFADIGMTVSSSDPANPVMVFDTANPTGGDDDLGTPNEDFGGPGIGDGGADGAPGENSVSLGNTLILSTDGNSADPNDHAGGGTITFTFDSPVKVNHLTILDIEEDGGTVVAYSDTAGTDQLSSSAIENLGNNSVQSVNVDTGGVRRIDVNLVGSGSVAGLVVCPEPQEECVECEGGVTSMTIEHDRSENDVHMRIWEYVNGGWSVILNTEANGDPMVAAGDDVSFDVSDGASYVAVQIKDNVGHYNWFTKGYIKVDCSEEAGAGTTFGKYPDYIQFTVVDSESQAGPICPISSEPPTGGQGCTPGYWRQSHHFDDWVGASPYDSFDATFGVNAGNITMLQAVWARGGGLNALNRHAVAAYLGASNPDVSYGLTVDEVVALVQEAYNGGDVEGIKNQLDELNNAGCPLGGGGNGGSGGNDNDNSNGGHSGNSNDNSNGGHDRGGYGNSNRHYGGYDRNSNRHYGGYSRSSNRHYGGYRKSNRHYGGYSRSNRGGYGYGYSRDDRRGGYGNRHSRRGGH